MQNQILSNFLNKAVQTSNRRVIPTDLISEAIELFEKNETRIALISLADIKENDLILSDQFLKKQLKIFGKPHKALSLKISINQPQNTAEFLNSESNTYYLAVVERPKNPTDLFEVKYSLSLHYGNGKQTSSQTLATHSEFFDISNTKLNSNEIGIQQQISNLQSIHSISHFIWTHIKPLNYINLLKYPFCPYGHTFQWTNFLSLSISKKGFN